MSCVERGRWHGAQRSFEGGETAYPRLRGQKVAQVSEAYAARGAPIADQLAVWGEVAAGHVRLGSRSATGAMRDAYVERHAELARAQERLRCPSDGAVGVVALVGGQAVCADVFDQATTLASYWPRLVRSYALEALGATAAPPSLDSARQLLQRALAAQPTAFASPGLGEDMRIDGDGIVGAALVWENVAVHTALFRRQPDRRDPPLRRPTERARWTSTR